MLPDFDLEELSEISSTFRSMGIFNFHEACNYIHQLPYGRITNSADYLSVLSESKGTCSSKHGILGHLSEVHGEHDIHLMVGIFLMSEKTHPAVADILKIHGLQNLPEAHAYFRFEGKRYDFTTIHNTIDTIAPFIVREQRCEPGQMINWKPMIHKNYLESWLKRQDNSLTLEEIWAVRESCISALS